MQLEAWRSTISKVNTSDGQTKKIFGIVGLNHVQAQATLQSNEISCKFIRSLCLTDTIFVCCQASWLFDGVFNMKSAHILALTSNEKKSQKRFVLDEVEKAEKRGQKNVSDWHILIIFLHKMSVPGRHFAWKVGWLTPSPASSMKRAQINHKISDFSRGYVKRLHWVTRQHFN